MNYISGLMLGASLVNMLRQSVGGAGGMNAGAAQGMGGGRSAQGGGASSGFASAAGGLALGGAALTGLLGGGRMGGGASLLSSGLLGGGRMGGGASLLSSGLLGGGRGGRSSPLTGLLGMTGHSGGAQSVLPSGLFGGTGRADGSAGRLPSAGGREGATSAPPQMKSVGEKPFVCVHASAGRRRYRTPYLTEAFAKVLEESLVRLPFVTEVRANATAGSILLTYEPEDEAHILVLAEGMEAIFAQGHTAPPPATLAQSVRRSVQDFSGWIQRHTGGALDLSSVVAGVFVLRGIRQLVLTNNTPSGSQMLWWALTLMRGWKV